MLSRREPVTPMGTTALAGVVDRGSEERVGPDRLSAPSEIAQLAEQLTVNQRVAGSSPALGAVTKRLVKGSNPGQAFLLSEPVTGQYTGHAALLLCGCWSGRTQTSRSHRVLTAPCDRVPPRSVTVTSLALAGCSLRERDHRPITRCGRTGPPRRRVRTRRPTRDQPTRATARHPRTGRRGRCARPRVRTCHTLRLAAPHCRQRRRFPPRQRARRHRRPRVGDRFRARDPLVGRPRRS